MPSSSSTIRMRSVISATSISGPIWRRRDGFGARQSSLIELHHESGLQEDDVLRYVDHAVADALQVVRHVDQRHRSERVLGVQAVAAHVVHEAVEQAGVQ